jgi:hypothetical protein
VEWSKNSKYSWYDLSNSQAFVFINNGTKEIRTKKYIKTGNYKAVNQHPT